MPRRQEYCFERVLRCELGGRCTLPAIHHGVCNFCQCWRHFMKMQETNQPLHYLRRRRSIWPLDIAQRKRFSLGNFWRMWATCKKEPTSIACNNQGCIALVKNRTHHSRTKHIKVQHHLIRDKLKNQKICLKYCPTEDMIADVLTKPLANDRHQPLTKKRGLEAFNYSQSGSVEDRALDCS